MNMTKVPNYVISHEQYDQNTKIELIALPSTYD